MALSGIYPVTLQGVQFEQTWTSLTVAGFPGFLPGDACYDNLGGIWVFVKAGSAIAVYDLVTISNALIPISASATTTTIAAGPVPLGIAQIAIASGSFGWVWRGPGGGVGHGIKCNLAASCALDITLYTTGTAGVVDDANVDESVVCGLKSTATITTAAAAEVIASIPLTCNIFEPD